MFLQRMDILDALDEGLLAIDANSQVSYLNQAASQILQIDQVKAVGRPLSEVYPQSTIPRVMRTRKAEYNKSRVQYQFEIHYARFGHFGPSPPFERR